MIHFKSLARFRYADLQYLPRHQGGDYGKDRPLILITGDRSLWIWPGQMTWIARGTYDYFSTKLMYSIPAANRADRSDHQLHDMRDGGRIGRKLLKRYDKQIRKIFRLDFDLSQIYRRGVTIVID